MYDWHEPADAAGNATKELSAALSGELSKAGRTVASSAREMAIRLIEIGMGSW
jgi:hypothetical protein